MLPWHSVPSDQSTTSSASCLTNIRRSLPSERHQKTLTPPLPVSKLCSSVTVSRLWYLPLCCQMHEYFNWVKVRRKNNWECRIHLVKVERPLVKFSRKWQSVSSLVQKSCSYSVIMVLSKWKNFIRSLSRVLNQSNNTYSCSSVIVLTCVNLLQFLFSVFIIVKQNAHL